MGIEGNPFPRFNTKNDYTKAMDMNDFRKFATKHVGINGLVLDDVIILRAGSQIPADAEVLDGSVQVNEALITGEADEISKTQGMKLLSGSFVVSGECMARLTAVGRSSYISKLTLEATKDKKTEESEMIK